MFHEAYKASRHGGVFNHHLVITRNFTDRRGAPWTHTVHSVRRWPARKAKRRGVAGGLLIGLGDDQITPDRPMPSEYGLAGAPAYLSVSWFF